jgi:hypothetical protein
MALVVFREQQLSAPLVLFIERGNELKDLLPLKQLVCHPDRHRKRERFETIGCGSEVHAQQAIEFTQWLLVENDGVDLMKTTALLGAVIQGIDRESRVVAPASEALFLGRGDNGAIAEQCGRTVMVVSGNSDDVHWSPALELASEMREVQADL